MIERTCVAALKTSQKIAVVVVVLIEEDIVDVDRREVL
jgi:hypothetical protein